MIEINNKIYLDGKEFKIISGAIHYFRVVPEYWLDRLEKLRNMGCNTVETIVPWNIHEPFENSYNFEGINNLRVFIETAQSVGLYVVIRPSPYICGEWEYGGTPYWLSKKSNMRLRSSSGTYLEYVFKYYDVLFKQFKGLYINEGGPIILMQIENEYGYFSNDKKYLLKLKDKMISCGCKVPLFTSDGPWGDAIESGNLMDHGVLETLNCGSNTLKHFDEFSLRFPNKPLICMEYWIGWFDAYGEKHHLRSAENCANELENILSNGHVNIYVFHGGTNFGFMNGANNYDKYSPLVTSYDYDALLSENGSYTEKYEKFQKIISKYNTIDVIPLSTNIKYGSYNAIKCESRVSLFDILDDISDITYNDYPLTFEDLDYPYGYVIYQSNLGKERRINNLKIYKGRDRAQFYLDGKYITTQYDREIGNEFSLGLINNNSKLSILMENMGRSNFHEKMDFEYKGIKHSVLVNKVIHTNWKHYCLNFDKLNNIELKGKCIETNIPTISVYNLKIKECYDTYIETISFGKGIVILNGFILGRFWNVGPQERLYIPAPLLKVGNNKIIVFETEGVINEEINFYKDAKWTEIEHYESVENN